MESNNKEDKKILLLNGIDVDLSKLTKIEINELEGYINGRKLLNKINSPILDKDRRKIDLLDKIQVLKTINNENNNGKRNYFLNIPLKESAG